MTKNILSTRAFFAVLFILSGCSSFETALRLWPDEYSVPVVPDIDYSYPVSGNVAALGTIGLVR
ncbi:MAG: hypothetical protein LBF75_03320 [Treponema sp.]|nr:hypothetical protein [Treponema sp.]